MRIRSIILMMSLFLVIGGIPAGAEEDWADMPTADRGRQTAETQGPSAVVWKAAPEQVVDMPVEIKGLDVRQMRIDLLKWKVRYLDCLITNLELAYRVKAYQDAQYIEIKRQLEETNRELRALIIGAPNIKKDRGPQTEDRGKKTDDGRPPTANK